MNELRPTEEELRYVGFTPLQIILINDVPNEIAWDAYYLQLENLMSNSDDEVEI